MVLRLLAALALVGLGLFVVSRVGRMQRNRHAT
jgi:flagellar biogenesis protein FliO